MNKILTFKHVSKMDLGDSAVFTPRVPETALVSIEGNIPRVCVSPSVGRCIHSIISSRVTHAWDLLYEFRSNIEDFEDLEEWIDRDGIIVSPSIYSTDELPYLPPKASDFRQNKEMWFLKPVTLIRNGYVDLWKTIETGKVCVSYFPIEIKGSVFLDQELKKLTIKLK